MIYIIKFEIVFIIVRVFIGIYGAPYYKIPPNNENRSPCLLFGGVRFSNRERGLVSQYVIHISWRLQSDDIAIQQSRTWML